MKNKNQETDGYGRDKRPKTEKTETEGNNDNWKPEKNWNRKKQKYGTLHEFACHYIKNKHFSQNVVVNVLF